MKKIKLNIGGGNVKLPGYKVLDGKFGDDLTKLNYKDNSVDEIYASHVLEYFDQIEVVDVLREWYRVLKKGGIIRIAVPDFYEMTQLYLGIRKVDLNCIKPVLILRLKKLNIRDLIGPLFGRMEMDGKTIYHKTTYDYETLAQLLYQIGFKRIAKYDCESVKPFSQIDDQSHAYIPHMNKKGTLISLNLEATK